MLCRLRRPTSLCCSAGKPRDKAFVVPNFDEAGREPGTTETTSLVLAGHRKAPGDALSITERLLWCSKHHGKTALMLEGLGEGRYRRGEGVHGRGGGTHQGRR
jgi:hypothetical protein